jgi:energy-coupling factor transporter transmembrane protein EcfT
MVRPRKLPARFAPVVMPFLLSLLMTALVSLISTARSVGIAPELLRLWPGNWALSWLVAFPVTLVVLPIVRRLTAAVVDVPR